MKEHGLRPSPDGEHQSLARLLASHCVSRFLSVCLSVSLSLVVACRSLAQVPDPLFLAVFSPADFLAHFALLLESLTLSE